MYQPPVAPLGSASAWNSNLTVTLTQSSSPTPPSPPPPAFSASTSSSSFVSPPSLSSFPQEGESSSTATSTSSSPSSQSQSQAQAQAQSPQTVMTDLGYKLNLLNAKSKESMSTLNAQLKSEFQALEQFAGSLSRDRQSWVTAGRPENRPKNRYGDILANEATRFRLAAPPSGYYHFSGSQTRHRSGGSYDRPSSSGGGPPTDYINANVVDGSALFGIPFRYICAQAPLRHTVEDFWAMIWAAQVNVVVMLCQEFEGGREKCACYWPKSRDYSVSFGRYAVELLREDPVGADLVRRVLQVSVSSASSSAASLTVVHYHFVGWPDHGVPDNVQSVLNVLLNFHRELTSGATPNSSTGGTSSSSGASSSAARIPMALVHCSAGIGRTGVLVTSHVLYALAQSPAPVLASLASPSSSSSTRAVTSVPQVLQVLRSCRNHLVESFVQYQYLYLVLRALLQNPQPQPQPISQDIA